MIWPPLPTTGFIAGRPATIEDLDQGRAVFCQHTEDAALSESIDIKLPQYVIWHESDKVEVPAILVQAERHITDPYGDALFGLRTLDSREVVANSGEVTLLGESVSSS